MFVLITFKYTRVVFKSKFRHRRTDNEPLCIPNNVDLSRRKQNNKYDFDYLRLENHFFFEVDEYDYFNGKNYLVRAYAITRYLSFHRTGLDTFRKLCYALLRDQSHVYYPITGSITYVEHGSTGTSIIMAFPGNVKIRKGVHAQLKKVGLLKGKRLTVVFC